MQETERARQLLEAWLHNEQPIENARERELALV
jgi:hypothetical protein